MVDDDDSDGFPSPEPRTDSRSALSRDFRAWRRVCIVKRDESFSIFFSRTRIYGVKVEVGGAPGAHEAGGRAQGAGAPPPSWLGCGPLALILWQYFLLFPKIISVEFQVIPRTFVSAHK